VLRILACLNQAREYPIPNVESASSGDRQTLVRESNEVEVCLMIQRKTLYQIIGLSVCTGVIIAAARVSQISASAQSGSSANAGAQITGTWFGEGLLPVAGSGPLAVLQEFHSDGTFIEMDQSDYGGAPFTRKNGPVMGTWSRLGDHSYRVKGLFMDFNGSTNVITAISVFEATAEIEPGIFDHMIMTGTQVDYACSSTAAFPFIVCPDPLLPTATPTTRPSSVQIRSTRMRPN